MSATVTPRTRSVRPAPAAAWVVHPYYTGRDKGCLRDGAGVPLKFFSEGHAWSYVFSTAQPNDARAKDNYRVVTLAQYEAGG